jgi:4-aminobutyrate aminotransferase
MDSVSANSISTFGGNPLSCAGALANLQYLLDHDLQANTKARGDQLMGLLQPVADRHPAVGELRGKGLMIGLEFVGADGYAPDPQTASAVLEGARERGLLVGKGGLHGNCLRIAPPLSLAEDEAAEGAAILAEALDAALS